MSRQMYPYDFTVSKICVLQIKDAIISHGCFLRECIVEHSVVGERSRLDSGVEVKVVHITSCFNCINKMLVLQAYRREGKK